MHLLNGAVERIQRIYGVQTFHVYGQSGGGAVTAALLNLRDDIGCAAIASGNLNVDRWLSEQRGDRRQGQADWYNPMTHINPNTLRPRVAIVSDPRDRRVSYGSQESYVRALERAGGQVVHIIAAGTPPDHHATVSHAYRALRQCLAGTPMEQIKSALDQPDVRKLVPAGR
jgi:pimeloyl-ACP methyl ester carboxylesterase